MIDDFVMENAVHPILNYYNPLGLFMNGSFSLLISFLSLNYLIILCCITINLLMQYILMFNKMKNSFNQK